MPAIAKRDVVRELAGGIRKSLSPAAPANIIHQTSGVAGPGAARERTSSRTLANEARRFRSLQLAGLVKYLFSIPLEPLCLSSLARGEPVAAVVQSASEARSARRC